MTDLSRFDELRTKTEKQLIRLINNEVDLGVRAARRALWSTDRWAVVEECHRRAKRELPPYPALAARTPTEDAFDPGAVLPDSPRPSGINLEPLPAACVRRVGLFEILC